jgi:hypothetical protein
MTGLSGAMTEEKDMTMRSLMLAVCSAVFLVTACSPGSAANPDGAAGNPAATSDTAELTPAGQFIAGTLALEMTDLAVTPPQAQALLPLWKAYQALSSSDTAAPAELEALINQIGETMTSDQRAAISAMDLQPSSVGEVLGQAGLGGQVDEAREAGSGARPGAGGQFGGGAPPEGFVPGGGQGPAGSGAPEGLGPEQQATMQALRDSRSINRDQLGQALLRPLIALLELRAAE